MNLLKLLKDEVRSLNIDNERDIKDYIYLRTGQIFNYNPLYLFSNENEKEYFRNEKVDIRNVDKFELTCFSWAPLFSELLSEFNINSEVIKNKEHAFVLVYIDNDVYLSDLMNRHEDLMRIKFGLPTLFNVKITTNTPNYITQKPKVNNKTKMEQGLIDIKSRLEAIRQKEKLPNHQYTHLVYKTITQIMKIPRDNVGFVAASAFIGSALQFFTDYNYYPNITYFYDNNKGDYIKVYSVINDNNVYYFTSESINGKYNFGEKTPFEVNKYISEYYNVGLRNLIVKKKIKK